jgi:hypothetical protein
MYDSIMVATLLESVNPSLERSSGSSELSTALALPRRRLFRGQLAAAAAEGWPLSVVSQVAREKHITSFDSKECLGQMAAIPESFEPDRNI